MILTRQFLHEQYSSNQYLSESTIIKHAEDTIHKEFDIFLSHSYVDKKSIQALTKILEKCGYSFYVDWIEDKHLERSNVSIKTASLLRERMSKSKSLAFITTSNSVNSKWCPWELGYFDGLKERCCVLPILEYQTNQYKGLEYLGLYPYLDYKKTKNGYEFCINSAEQDGKYDSLRNWLITGKLK